MKTEISTDRNAAVELLRNGEAVALPTETVYGLAADALNPIAVAKIFEAKGRPRFDPLIVHLPDHDWLEKIAALPAQDRQLIFQLGEKFWPGPFTRAFGNPLAAPSANRFGRISPTTARHVLEELDGHISLIIDAGPTTHGIESTIAAVHDRKIDILRRGPVTSEQLSAFGKVDIATDREKISAPGQLPSHYAPKTPLRMVDDLKSFAPETNERCALLAWNPVKSDERFVAIRTLSEKQDLREAAANLFRFLRELDELDLDLIVAERVPAQGLGAAILDRLQRASHA